MILENGNLVSTPTNMAVSTLTVTTAPNTAKMAITTNTASNPNWPIAKTMDEYIPGSLAGNGLGGTYKEYRQINKVPGSGNAVDEELQVWTWNAGTGKSYATQYRDVTGSGNPALHQAWSFGGNYTTAAQMPTSGSATYSGRFGAIAVTSNFINDPNATAQTLDRNNRWSVTGDTAITANFSSAGTITGTLTPTAWNAWQTLNGGIGFATATAAGNPANWFSALKGGYMDVPIQLSGTIKSNVSPTGNTKPNTITGVAQYDPNGRWINTKSNSFFNAGFFGDNADNITGSFSMDAQIPDPISGIRPINDDRRGYVSMQGIFNACKTGPIC